MSSDNLPGEGRLRAWWRTVEVGRFRSRRRDATRCRHGWPLIERICLICPPNRRLVETPQTPVGMVQVGWIAPHVLDHQGHWRSFHRDHENPFPSSQEQYDELHEGCLPVYVPMERK